MHGAVLAPREGPATRRNRGRSVDGPGTKFRITQRHASLKLPVANCPRLSIGHERDQPAVDKNRWVSAIRERRGARCCINSLRVLNGNSAISREVKLLFKRLRDGNRILWQLAPCRQAA